MLFSEGGCSRDGIASIDIVDLPTERNEVIKLKNVDTKRYFEGFRRWGSSRMERQKAEGCKKARA